MIHSNPMHGPADEPMKSLRHRWLPALTQSQTHKKPTPSTGMNKTVLNLQGRFRRHISLLIYLPQVPEPFRQDRHSVLQTVQFSQQAIMLQPQSPDRLWRRIRKVVFGAEIRKVGGDVEEFVSDGGELAVRYQPLPLQVRYDARERLSILGLVLIPALAAVVVLILVWDADVLSW